MKYLKLFEDFDEDDDNLHKVSEDIIVDFVLSQNQELEYHVMNELIDDFDICEAIACYIHDYNENTPYIHYLRNLLTEHKFRPGASFTYRAEDLDEEKGKMVYDEFAKTNIYEKILNSNQAYTILNYLKTNYYWDFYKEFAKYTKNGIKDVDNASKMGETGYSD